MTTIDTLYDAPAKKSTKKAEPANRRGYWQEEITKAEKRFGVFQRAGTNVQDRYRLERESQSELDVYQDRYNILYSSTETTKTSLYAQSPKVEAVKRHPDSSNPLVTQATLLIESIGQFGLEEVDFDGVMKNVVQDFLLPGMGSAWLRYEPEFESKPAADGKSAPTEKVKSECVCIDYVYFKDFLVGVCRVWKEAPWVARRVYFNKEMATKRFGKEKADRLTYTYRPADDGNGNREFAGGGGEQSIIWEIWDKKSRKVCWFAPDYPDDVLDERDDPLKLKNFFPCPEPIRAVWTTRTFIPKAFYSEYRAQAEELDNLTQRIRYLTKALRVTGVYDGSQEQLKNMLTGNDNKLIAVQNWALFAQQGGIQGSIQWMPIKDVAEVLMNLLQQRDVVKNEIYEITGFSDIVRGVSKASETLGAQKIKSEWAGGRMRDMQKEVQRFCRDVIRIMSEIQCEHFAEETLALYAGFEPPEVTPEEQAAAAQYAAAKVQFQQGMAGQQQQMPQQLPPQGPPGVPPQPGMPQAPPPPMQPPQPPPPTQQQQAIQQFQKVVKLIRTERARIALIGIETDSTIAADEAAERKDRMDFLGAAGAFLQQAGPMALQYPEMRGLLGSMLMFTIRTFRSSRSIEKYFEEFQKKLEASPPQDVNNNKEGKGGADPAELQAKAQMQQAELQAQATMQTEELQAKGLTEKYKADKQAEVDMAKINFEHQYKMAELELRRQEVGIKEGTLLLDSIVANAEQELQAAQAAHDQGLEIHEANEAADQQDHSQGMAEEASDLASQQAAQQAAQAQSEAAQGGGPGGAGGA